MAMTSEEWMRQSRYDIATAEALCRVHRYVYAVFLCHLALEKALKGLCQRRTILMPPKTHSLIHLRTKEALRWIRKQL